MKMHKFYEKRTLFINKYLVFSKNYIVPSYKKLQTLISAFIKNLIFGKNRDPCCWLLILSKLLIQWLLQMMTAHEHCWTSYSILHYHTMPNSSRLLAFSPWKGFPHIMYLCCWRRGCLEVEAKGVARAGETPLMARAMVDDEDALRLCDISETSMPALLASNCSYAGVKVVWQDCTLTIFGNLLTWSCSAPGPLF